MGRLILRNMIILTLISVIFASFFTLAAVYRIFNENTRDDLRREADLIIGLLDEGYTFTQLKESQAINEGPTRITIIARDGEVLYDNRADASQMDNHLMRQEVQEAMEEGTAESFRLSSTLGRQTFYYATLMDDGTVLRFAKTTDSPLFTLYRLMSLIGLVVLAVALVAFTLAERMVKGILTPINNIDLDKPLENEIYDELAPLLTRVSRQQKEIRRQVTEIENKQEEFLAITGNMAEGLLIIDAKTRIVSINPSALRILSEGTELPQHFLGKSVWTLTRDISLQKSIQQGLEGKSTEPVLAVGDKRYQAFVNPVFDYTVIRGLIILLWDITQKYEAEQMRKEFSGNVSHELKTPLTSISSYAELMKNDMVKAEDRQRFAQHIYDETQRMIALVEDILKLSRLDEKVELHPREDLDLLSVVQSVVVRLQPLAGRNDVTLSVTGEPVSIVGDRAILFEMIYNLIHNGIKYNRKRGHVQISCTKHGDKAVLQVADNGIGIPKAHQERVFERFYRVDKSHSKKTGGTGLGLSIVKHGARYHNADIKLESVENQGTTVAILFPIRSSSR